MTSLRDTGLNPDADPFIINCLDDIDTRHDSVSLFRDQANGLWLTNRSRLVSLTEMARFQGIGSSDITFPWYRSDVESTISNAMPANVVEQVLVHLLPATGLVSGAVKDRWTSFKHMSRSLSAKSRSILMNIVLQHCKSRN